MTTTGQTKPVTGGAPPGNSNRMTHGLRSVTLGKLPPGASYVAKLTTRLRALLESELLARGQDVSLADAFAVNTACRWERHALLAQHYLRTEFAQLKPEQRIEFSRQIAVGSERRDAALKALGLDRKPSDPWDALDALPVEPASDDAPDASEGTSQK